MMNEAKLMDMANKLDAMPNNVKFIIVGVITLFFVACFIMTRHLESVIAEELAKDY